MNVAGGSYTARAPSQCSKITVQAMAPSASVAVAAAAGCGYGSVVGVSSIAPVAANVAPSAALPVVQAPAVAVPVAGAAPGVAAFGGVVPAYAGMVASALVQAPAPGAVVYQRGQYAVNIASPAALHPAVNMASPTALNPAVNMASPGAVNPAAQASQSRPPAPLEAEVFSNSQNRWNRAQVVSASGGTLHLAWCGLDGKAYNKQIAEDHEHIRWLEVEVFSNSQNCWDRARISQVKNGIITLSYFSKDGRPCEKQLPFGHDHVRPAGVEDPKPWLDAARTFVMNTDFDITDSVQHNGRCMDVTLLFNIMKKESAGKRTIQAMGDKIILSLMLDNLGVPQMPMYFAARRDVEREQVYSLVENLERSPKGDLAFDVVCKPTHMSNGLGAVIFDKDRWDNEDGGWNKERLYVHIKKYLGMQANDGESEALKSLIPGFIVQPRYRSVLDFKTPLEVRVVTLWGKTRLGIWWWGKGVREERRNTWLIRHPLVRGELGSNDKWEILHEHMGENPGFEEAVRLFQKAMPAISAAAEGIATAVGAPFLRSDFFVGSQEWGVRLNEVAYGSGTDYRQRPVGSACLVDDGPTIARILQEGYMCCQERRPPETFLSKLGADGARYESLTVQRIDNPEVGLPADALHGFYALAAEGTPQPMSLEACTTMVLPKFTSADKCRISHPLTQPHGQSRPSVNYVQLGSARAGIAQPRISARLSYPAVPEAQRRG